MSKPTKYSLATAAILSAWFTGCAWTQIAYSPNPAAVRNPAEAFERLAMTPKRFRPTKIEMHETFATILYTGEVAGGGIKSVPVPFNEIEQIFLLQNGDEFAVRAVDGSGAKIYEYVAMDSKKATELIDALSALANASRRNSPL